ncbi:type II secretion system F family protein [Planobispora takensis]|uniref:VWFA domain-containing protein n=1 Tax=Planobispora takensis TaxID=1367882 RepID=A0A8J3X0L5_9ACTN|nr:type II secretion system F family protein [Planobispora takensis]GII05872.1 hypothetical protein Pta02_78800 [Planobispora takensis]
MRSLPRPEGRVVRRGPGGGRAARFTASALAALTAVLTLAVAIPAAAVARLDDELSAAVSAVRVTAGQAQFYLTARNLPEGVSLDEAQVTVRAGNETLAASVEASGGGSPGGGPERSVVIVFDASASMDGEPLARAQDAALRYAAAVPADVRIGLVRVGDEARTLLEPTADRRAFAAAVGGVRAQGSTALYDAVAEGQAVLARQPAGDRRMLVLSDGADTSSATSLDLLAMRLRREGAVLDVVAFGDGTDAEALRRLADSGTGQVRRATRGEELAQAFLSAAAAFSAPVRVTVRVPATLAGRSARMTVEVRAGGERASTATTVAFAADPRAAPGTGPAAVAVGGPPGWLYPVGGGALLGALLLGIAALAGPRRGLDSRRLAQLDRFALRRAAPQGGAGAAVQGVQGAALALTDKVVRARGRHERITVQLEQAGMRLLPHEWTLLRLGVSFAVTVLLGLLVSPVAGVLLGPASGWAGCAFYRRHRAARRARRFAEQLPDSLQLVVGSLRSGFSLGQALAALVRESAEPISTEFGRALAETRIGVDLEDALEKAAERTDCRDLSWLVMAIRIQREVGGNLAEIMATAVDTMRERARLRRHVRALTAEGRLSAYVLIALPIGIGAWMFLIRGEYVRPLYTEPLGIVMLGAAVLLVLAGAFWMSRLIKVEV